MKLGMCNELLKHQGLEEGFKHLARLGYNGVEVAPWTINPSVMDISDEDAKRVRATAEAAQIEILGLHWVFGNTSEWHLTHPDAAVRRRTQDYLEHIVRMCDQLGGKVIIFGSPNQRKVLEGVEPQRAWEYAKEILGSKAFLDLLEERDVTFCLEPLSINQTNFINTTEEARRFTEELHHSHFGMILDGYTLGWAGEDAPMAIRQAGKYLKHFHADDETGKGPGRGKLDYVEIATALRTIQFTGYVSVEIHNYDLNPEECASHCIQYLRRIFG
jgi:sugar phosphate isomerase/epimerase